MLSPTVSVAPDPGLPTVLVLASGRGERFTASGGQVHKLQAPLGASTVLEHTLAAVRASGLPWHVEQQGLPGMGDSIAAAVRATAGAEGWLVLPADLPLVRSDTLQKVAEALQHHRVVVPVHGGQRGHPVGFSRACYAQLAQLHGKYGAAPVVSAGAAIELIVGDAGILMDIDTLDDLRHVQSLLGDPGPLL
ncbi:MAG: molybdopterin-guanine dinucleotide biosynthesis protein MobA [Burkholderiales bacterium PBB3]|nr:MAG: molybdopterin-guanine dinucleotide biosynthesis protein MobA [Burkholderiales bacterium PBB3]